MKARALLSICVVLVASHLAAAQIPGMPDPDQMRFAPIYLLGRSDVAKELKLQKAQNEEIKKLAKELQTKTEAASKASRDPNDLSGALGAMKAMTAAQEDASAKAMALLDTDQATRFRGLRLQFVGPKLMLDPVYARLLDLTDDQLAQAQEVAGSEVSRMMGAFQSGGGAGMAKKLKEIKAQIAADLMAILTPEQAAKLKEIEGKEFGPAKKLRGF